MSGIIKVRKKENPFEQIERSTLQDTRLSLQALGLLVNVCSYPDSWEIHKTELYKRYPKNKETSVRNAWNELVELGYAMEKKYREGKKWAYEYAISTTPFTEEEKVSFMGTKEEQEKRNVRPLKTGFSGPQNEDLKMKTSKSSDNIYNIKDNTHEDNTHEDNTHLSISNLVNASKLSDQQIEDIKKLDGLIEDKSALGFWVNDALENKAKDLYAYVKTCYINDKKGKVPEQPTRTETADVNYLKGQMKPVDQEKEVLIAGYKEAVNLLKEMCGMYKWDQQDYQSRLDNLNAKPEYKDLPRSVKEVW